MFTLKSWKSHIFSGCWWNSQKRVFSVLDTLRRVKYILNGTLCKNYIFLYDQSKNSKPIYRSTIQNTMYLVNKIEHIHVQLKSVRIVMGDGLASRYLLYKATECKLLSKRREKFRFIQLLKIYHNMTPNHLFSIIQSKNKSKL